MPGAPVVMIGDISRRRGRRFRPHRSHQSGRDVDAAYYILPEAQQQANGYGWQRARSSTLDAKRQWRLFRYWIQQDIVTYIFVDRRLQRAMLRHAEHIGEDDEFLATVFQVHPNSEDPIIRYSPGHDDHFHVRFRCEERDTRCREF